MWNLRTLSFLLFVVSSYQYDKFYVNPYPMTSDCRESMARCAAKHLTGGKCRTVTNSIYMDLFRIDADGDCKSTDSERELDASVNYDRDGDGQICRNEWNYRRTTYNGFTHNFTDYEWKDGISYANECISLNQFGGVSEPSVYVLKYLERKVTQLGNFCKLGDNAKTSRDCAGLAMGCQDGLEKSFQCPFLGLRTMTMSGKISSLEGVLNPTDSNLVFEKAATDRLSKIFDNVGFGCIDEREWILGLTDANRQFSEKFAEYTFRLFPNSSDGSGCVKPNTIVMSLMGGRSPVYSTTVKDDLMEAVIDMCEATPSLYDMNPDCAQVYDACKTDFRYLSKCSDFQQNCGLLAYSRCNFLSNQIHCQDWGSRQAADVETSRVDKYHFEKECVPYSTMDGASSITVNGFILSLVTLLSMLFKN